MDQTPSPVNPIGDVPPIVPKSPFKITGMLVTKILSGVIGVVVVGGGVSLATRIWDPLWNPFRPNPAEVIEDMYQNMKDVKSLHMEAVSEIKDMSNESNSFVVNMSNNFDGSDLNNIRLEGDVSISGNNASGAASYVIDGQEAFLRIDEVNFPMGFDMAGLFTGQWIRFDMPDKQQFQTDITAKNIDELNDWLVFKRQMKDEKINGIASYHYVLGINSDKVKEKADEFYKEFSDYAVIPFSEIPDENKLNEQLEKIKDIDINIFIGKRDKMLYQITMYEESVDELSGDQAALDFALTLSDFNKEVNIEIPEDAKSFEEVFGELMGGVMQMLMPNGSFDVDFGQSSMDDMQNYPNYSYTEDDEATFALMDLSNVFKSSYDQSGSYKNFSCNLNSKTKELCGNIKSSIGSNPKIYASKDEFCMYFKLSSGDYFCVDKEMSVNLNSELDCSENYFYCSKFFMEKF